MLSIYQSKDHRWRDAYNPLRGLSLPKLVSLLESGERGQYADLQWFYHYMERSDAMVYAVIQRRRSALLSLDWDTVAWYTWGRLTNRSSGREPEGFLG